MSEICANFVLKYRRRMKYTLIISYWVLSILLVAFVLVSFGYRFMEALFIASLFLPGALAVKCIFSKISFKDKTKGILDASYVVLGIIVLEVLMFILAHWCVSRIRLGSFSDYNHDWTQPPIMYNPVFIAIIIAALSVGCYFYEKWLEIKFPSEEKPVTFLSDRKTISLMRAEILYIESNDSITTVYAIQGRSFKNKTPISQWENYLGEGFLRIHRSYLVNVEHITDHDIESVKIVGVELPVSRKYRGTVKAL